MRRQKRFLKYVIATTLVVEIGAVLIKADDATGLEDSTGRMTWTYGGQCAG